MASLDTTAKWLILPLLSAIGIYCTWHLSDQNGFFRAVETVAELIPRRLPGSHAELKVSYTGIWYPVDYMLTVLAVTFWPAVDGSHPALSLQGFHIGGQYMAVAMLLEIEGGRLGNSWRLVSFTFFWIFLFQTAAFTAVAPLYYALHLFTSPASLSPSITSPSDPSTNLLVSPMSLHTLPLSTLLGYALPGVLMLLPSPKYTSFDTHQNCMALWQIFPLTVALLQFVFSTLARSIFPTNMVHHSAAERNADLMSALRRVYVFAFAVSSVTHIATMTLTLTSVILPSILNPNIVESFHPARAFLPPPPWAATPVKSIGDGLHIFSMYDEYIGFLATILWATVLNRNAHAGTIGLDGWMSLLAKVAGLTIVAGPASAVVALLWGRDELVLGGN